MSLFDCWRYPSTLDPHGYTTSRKGHRAFYETLIGPVPDELQVDHLCETTWCVNPAHLEAVTPRENVRRSNSPAAANARKTECPKGHAYDEANTYIDKKGKRYCRTCHRERQRRYRAHGEGSDD